MEEGGAEGEEEGEEEEGEQQEEAGEAYEEMPAEVAVAGAKARRAWQAEKKRAAWQAEKKRAAEEQQEEEGPETSFPTGPPTHEVQACSDRCDFPCTRLRPCKWDPCHILRSYPGGKEVDLLIEGEEYPKILSRHVRPLISNAPDAAAPPARNTKRRRE